MQQGLQCGVEVTGIAEIRQTAKPSVLRHSRIISNASPIL